MNFSDTLATDSEGNEFVFTVEMKRRLQDAGLPIDPANLDQLPDRPVERAPRRQDRQDQAPRRQDRQDQAPRHQDRRDSAPRRREAAPEPDTIQIDAETGKYIGRLKWYNSQRGYGFIARGGGEDIFFHKSDVITNPDDFVEGGWVLYDVEETAKGLEANEIEIYDGPPGN